MRRLELNVFADYFQFYLQDEGADTNLAKSWTQEAVSRLLAVALGAVGVGTVRNMDVPVVVEVLESEPERDFEGWDHVVECGLEVTNANIVIAGCTEYLPDAERIEVQPGTYRVRVSYGALDALSEDGLDGQDHYRVQLWLGHGTEPAVLKQRAA